METLLLKRAKSQIGQWCQVAGGIESGETAWQAALREIREETALLPERLYSADLLERFYEIDKDAVWIAPVFVAFVKPADKVTINEVHTEYRWLSIRRALSLLPFPGQREILRQVRESFVRRMPPDMLQIQGIPTKGS
jgi:dATP pyrophosphohydrolase